jgi:3-oxoacyl-[acyl-carrier-protein] synthase-1
VSDKVFVTGIGIISSIGMNKEETVTSLKECRSGIGMISVVETRHKGEIPVAEVMASNTTLREWACLTGRSAWSRTALLGILGARQALSDAHIKNINEFRTGLISATTVGGMDRSEIFYRDYIRNPSSGRLRNIITHDCADSTEQIADNLGIKEWVSTISTACSSSANAVMFGSRLIENGILDRVLVGGTDSLTAFTINGFNSLQILDKTGCKPIDEARNGLTLGEGAGYLMLESGFAVRHSGKKPLCEIGGYGNACDAYHQTASSPDGDGALKAMQKAITKADISPQKIDYINAHGTGTKNNDLSEGRAIKRLFGDVVPPFSSTKSFTGHTLGAAGAVEAVLCVMALENQWIYPNLNFNQEMTDLGISPVTAFKSDIPIYNIMSNSFGFGGNNTSLIFSAC